MDVMTYNALFILANVVILVCCGFVLGEIYGRRQ
jgi:hypothetical protein